MFFLGEINSVFPYLIYISLVWVFMIIGFHGKIIDAWHVLNPKEYHADNGIIHQPGCNTLIITQKDEVQHNGNIEGTVNAIDHYHPAVLYTNKSFQVNTAKSITSPLNSICLRGPPGFAIIS
jgi:hypothetical protein